MKRKQNEPEHVQHMRKLAANADTRFSTSVPFHLGKFRVEKIGVDRTPAVGLEVFCFMPQIGHVIPLARAFVYGELAGAGIPAEAVAFEPWLLSPKSRLQRFINTNESSPTKGKELEGRQIFVWFTICPDFVSRFVWCVGADSRRGSLPTAES